MKIIFAQGNPGVEYAHTRHNVGFLLLDDFAKKHGAEFAKKSKFHAEIAEFNTRGEKIILVKPLTFYNETGQAARALIDFYKIQPAQDFLVIHDDLVLPFGTIRTRNSGRDAGNNGIKSLNAHLGDQYARIKIGIYNELRDRIPDADFVLAHLTANERTHLKTLYEYAEQYVEGFIREDFTLTKVSVPLE